MRFTYVLTDIHGRYDLLTEALDRIEAHLNGNLGQVICLGDMVDRGPDSAAVVDRLMNSPITVLRGNHEQMMVDAIREPDNDHKQLHWIRNGGDATIESYGGAVPAEHMDWLSRLPLLAMDDHRVYVHAGLMPSHALEQQEAAVCMWIREPFLDASADDFMEKRHIVHGHSPLHAGKLDPAQPELLTHRTNLDTLAFASGVLSVGVFDADAPGGPIEVIRVECEPVWELVPVEHRP